MTPAKSPPIPPAPTAPPSARRVQFGKIQNASGHRIVLYGPGGIGKTTLAASMPGKTAFFDLDESLSRLKPQLEESGLLDNIVEVPGITTWADLRAALQSDGWDGVKNIIIDTGTKAEELAVAHTLATVKYGSNQMAKSVEDYGYGKGYQYIFDTFLPLLADLDRHARAGRNVVVICHDCTNSVPNPMGEDWQRYEPRLQSSGKSSIRLRVREWADHVLFLGYDIAVDKDGKGKGSGTRTLWPVELPHCMAKSRSTQTEIAVTGGVDVWSQIIK